MPDRLTKLILIEDDPGQARLIGKQLKRNAGVEVLAFDTGRKALDHLLGKPAEELRHHVIVLDINLPGIDGIEVLRRLRAHPVTALVPVVMLTTTDNPEEVRRCYQAGANLYLVKPMDYEAFKRTIDFLSTCLSLVQLP